MSRQLRFVGGAAAIFLCAFVFATSVGSQEPEGNFGVGIPGVFMPKYLAYRTAQLADPNPHVMRVRLGYVKGLSTNFTRMTGEMAVNLQTGAYTTSLSGLTPLTTYAVWLVDRSESDLIPPTPDTLFRLITFVAAGPTALLSGNLGLLGLPPGLTIDRVVVTPGLLGGGEQLAAGTVNVFQKIFFRRLSLENAGTGTVLFNETTPPPSLFALVPDLAAETDSLPPFAAVTKNSPMLALARFFSPPLMASGGSVKLDKLISQGADLFFNETFKGNGRTCGTCHPSNNNFTIDPPFIATLPPNDPLFVAEFNPALEQLERKDLMRQFGLILENVDGLENPTVKFVMRGVPHTLGMQVSLERDTSLPNPPFEMTGWSGDGAPGTGSLREFAIGAVTQHFTKRLNRVPGTDFKLPKEHQLDAMEAFQLSLGRSADFDLSKLKFNDTNVQAGKQLFIIGGGDPNFGGTCNFCHTNGGARSSALLNQNRNFNTNVEDRDHPARAEVQDFPKDGGFGKNDNGDGTFGNRSFNTPPVVEAADTAPFFHNNVEGVINENPNHNITITDALEEAVRFYIGPEFNNPRDPAARFFFEDLEINQLVAFLQGLNTLQNIDVARRELSELFAKQGNPRREQDTRLQTAFDETDDAIVVLTDGQLYPTAKTRLTEARNFISQAQVTEPPSQRRPLIQQAIAKLDAARNVVATITP